MGLGKQIRLNRLFSHPSGRLCSVAVDHFVGYAEGMHPGLADLPKTLAEIVAGRPDAVTMQKGVALTCWAPHAGKVPMIMQAGCWTVDERILEILTDAEECVVNGADAIAIAIGVRGPNEGKYIRLLAEGVTAAAKFDLPVIAHVYPKSFGPEGAKILHDAENIAWATRVGIECGADVIKVGYTGDVASFGQIVRSCPVPVVAAGGPKTETLEAALQAMQEVVQSGARGATIGRNVWGHGNIGQALAAFKAVIHDGKSPSEAIRLAGG
ncbi:MAG TPA: hypothetical protein VKT78_16855 [Fimbriimonadaceae bacterium]|nr:hypothetical protein [Fimbriimonadaceae bacterium]